MNVLGSVVGDSNVGVLSDYVENIENIEDRSFIEFLKCHVVARTKSLEEKRVPDVEEATISMTDLVNHVIGCLFKSAWPDEPNHMLTKGFRRLRQEMGRSHCGIRGISSYFPNPLVSECTNESWCRLLNRIGEARMLYLLMHCMIFRVDSTSKETKLTQISGHDFQKVLYETKRRKQEQQKQRLCSIRRNRIFYSSTFNREAGFPKKHVLNILSMNSVETIDTVARQLVRRVFRNPKSMYSKNSSNRIRRRFRRRRRRRVTTPWRVRETAFPLFKKLLQNHQRCRYVHLLHRCCPVSSYIRRRRLVRSIRTQCLTGQGYLSQDEEEEGEEQKQQHDEEEEEEQQQHYKEKEDEKDTISKLLKCSTSHEHVTNFITQVLSCLLPYPLWGSPGNRRVLLEKVQHVVSAGRDEDEITMSYLMNRISINSFQWIQKSKNSTRNPNEHSCRHDLASRWIQFLFADIIVCVLYLSLSIHTHSHIHINILLQVPLIRAHFYVTEVEGSGQGVVYYRKLVWAHIQRVSMDQLTSPNLGFLRHLSASKAREVLNDSNRSQGCALLRLLPKPEKGDLRPIMNLSSRTKAAHARRFGKSTLSVNASLADAFAVLDGERRRRADLTGSSVFDLDCIYKRLRPFVISEARKKKIYIVSADVAHCYDSIDQRKLLKLLQKSVVVDSEYEIRRTTSMMFSSSNGGGVDFEEENKKKRKRSMNQVMMRRSRLSLPLRSIHMEENDVLVGGGRRKKDKEDRLVVDGIVRKYMKRRDVMNVIQTHVKRSVVRMGNQYFSQVKGVPQGSVMSTVLCNLYYGMIEKKFLGFPEYTDKDSTYLLMRLTDDFLLITTSRSQAESFARKIHQGLPEYGFQTNTSKTKLNFECSYDDHGTFPVVQERWLKWCGIRIDTNTMEVSVDYSRFVGKHVRDTIKLGQKDSIVRHIQSFTARKLHRMFLDMEMNTFETICRNLFVINVLVAMKFHCYNCNVSSIAKKKTNDMDNSVRAYCDYICKLVMERSLRSSSSSFSSSLTSENLKWICYVIFHRVLSFTHESRLYRNLLKSLKLSADSCSRGTSHRKLQLAFRACEFEMNCMMRDIYFC